MRSLVLAVSFLASCAATPTYVLDLMDAESEVEAERAAEKASGYLIDRKRDLQVRHAAAKTLGRLRHPAPEVIARLGQVLRAAHLKTFGFEHA